MTLAMTSLISVCITSICINIWLATTLARSEKDIEKRDDALNMLEDTIKEINEGNKNPTKEEICNFLIKYIKIMERSF